MDLTIDEAVARLAADPALPRRASARSSAASPPPSGWPQAIAAYERTIYSVDSPFDRFMAGDAGRAEPGRPARARALRRQGALRRVPRRPQLHGRAFHGLGCRRRSRPRGGHEGAPKDHGRFKTPTLREIARTAPYMHDGSLATLAEVVDYYDRGGQPHPNLDEKMTKLGSPGRRRRTSSRSCEALYGTVVDVPAAAEHRRRSLDEAASSLRPASSGCRRLPGRRGSRRARSRAACRSRARAEAERTVVYVETAPDASCPQAAGRAKLSQKGARSTRRVLPVVQRHRRGHDQRRLGGPQRLLEVRGQAVRPRHLRARTRGSPSCSSSRAWCSLLLHPSPHERGGPGAAEPVLRQAGRRGSFAHRRGPWRAATRCSVSTSRARRSTATERLDGRPRAAASSRDVLVRTTLGTSPHSRRGR